MTGYDKKMKEVFDFASDIVIYNVEKNTIYNFPKIASEKRENLPCWSPDGKYLYYTCAKEYVTDMPNEENLYSLMRVSFDVNNNIMGDPETIIPSEETKKSVAFPTISPDGKYIYFNSVRTGQMKIWRMNADGSGKRQITFNGAANFAPFFHPDNRRIIFASNMADPKGRDSQSLPKRSGSSQSVRGRRHGRFPR